MDVDGKSSRLPGFYELPISERARLVSTFSSLTVKEAESFQNFGNLNKELADIFIENSIGTFSLPLGIATNFKINKKDLLIPMAVEESSVLAAASHGAKLARLEGGFSTSSSDPIMTGQIQIFIAQSVNFDELLTIHKDKIILTANKGQNRLCQRGGGAKDLSWHYIKEIQCLVVHLHIDTRDAMGANIVNSMCEKVAGSLVEIFPECRVGLRILTNLTDRRTAKATCVIPPTAFTHRDYSGAEVARRIAEAWEFAWFDVYRATTHNKGIMNGIDPVLIATGNDWRAVEAGAHAYTCRSGVYRPMTTWKADKDGYLYGELELPMAVGTVGGVTKLHPMAQVALKLLGNPSACELSEIICAVGLAQNLSALRALATEGIQLGHMGLHQKNLELLRKTTGTEH